MALDKRPRVVKCVVVGDNCGYRRSGICTELIISYTTGVGYGPNSSLPTVSDNYSQNLLVEGQPVTLNLWDLEYGGNNEKLRPLSYPGTDVFIVLFSLVGGRSAFERTKSMWAPELTRHCPGVPILLVGCELELRTDPKALQTLREQVPSTTPIKESLRM